jgi:hypothetical protein
MMDENQPHSTELSRCFAGLELKFSRGAAAESPTISSAVAPISASQVL